MNGELTTADIPGFPGYTIRSDGKVFKQGVEKVVSCKKGRSAKVIIRVNKKMYTLGLATLIAEAFLPNPFKYKNVIFKDRNHHNCHVNNIAWVDSETYFYYCCPQAKRGRPKIYVDREVAIRTATDDNIRNYYISLDEYWMEEAFKDVDKEMSQFDFWPLVKGEVYAHFVDRCKRFSILGKGPALMWYYAKSELIKLKRTISPNIPYRKLMQTDESMRIIGREHYDY
jgi:hypothetical protein